MNVLEYIFNLVKNFFNSDLQQDSVDQSPQKKTYNKTQLNKMTKSDLLDLGKNNYNLDLNSNLKKMI
jgi:hypothetical protein